MRRKVLIIGGGIGGLALALMLNRRGLACEIFEQAGTQLRELGVGIESLAASRGRTGRTRAAARAGRRRDPHRMS